MNLTPGKLYRNNGGQLIVFSSAGYWEADYIKHGDICMFLREDQDRGLLVLTSDGISGYVVSWADERLQEATSESSTALLIPT